MEIPKGIPTIKAHKIKVEIPKGIPTIKAHKIKVEIPKGIPTTRKLLFLRKRCGNALCVEAMMKTVRIIENLEISTDSK